MFRVNIYIESNLKGFRRQQGWYGRVVEYQKSNGELETREDFECLEATSNQIMLIAVTESLKILNKECHVKVYMDSEYVSNMVIQGRPKQWALNDWRTAKNEPVANQKEWQQLMEQLDKHKVEFACTKGHAYSEWLKKEIKERKEGKEKWEQQKLSQ